MKFILITIGVLITIVGCLGAASRLRVKHSVDLNAAVAQVDELPLPRHLSVDGYQLELQPFIEEGRYKGRVKINVTVNDETNSITVHAHPNLRIVSKPAQEISIKEIVDDQEILANKSISVTGTHRDLEKHWFIINLAETLKRTATYQIELRFSGDLDQDKNIGLFRKRFTDKVTEEKRWYAATKMSPTNARTVFPCFDEPMLKAPIELSVARLAHMKSMSVMPIRVTENVTNEAGWMWDHFHRTPPMSTFSFGLLITDLQKLKSSTILNNKEQVVVSVYGREELREQLETTALLAPKLLEFFQRYLDLNFPLPELNIVALPNYDDTESADHWGLVMFKESSLVDAALWRLTSEIANQWIGHLITPHWWSDLRVASGLSSYLGITAVLSAVCSEAWHPSSGYSIYYEFSKPHPFAGIPTMKQTIHSHSTQWLFRMLNYTLGETTFQQGIQTFARERQFLTFSEDDVWKALTEEAHADKVLDESMKVETVTRGWMNEDRFPVVTVKRDYKSNTASVKQHVFLRARPHDIGDKNSLTWWIPVMYLTSENVSLTSLRTSGWMKSEKEITIKSLPDKNEFVVLNPVEIGMFIVNYDQHNWHLISEYLVKSSRGEAPMLDSDVRTKLLHDAWNLAYSGELSFATALNMTLFLEYEREFVVWETMFTMIDHVGRDICHTDAGKKFLEYSQQLMIPMYESLGSETENEHDPTKKKLKSMTKYFLCNGNYLPCITQAKEVYKSWMQMPDPEIGNPVPDSEMCLVFKWGTMEEWKFGLQRVINFPPNRKQQERSNMIRSLAGCPRQIEKVKYFLNVTILENNSTFSDSDTQLGINMLSGDALGYSTLFEFLVDNWDAIKSRYENSPYMWEYMVSKAVGSFKTQDGLNKVSKLYAERKGQFSSAESIVIEKLKKAIEEAKWTNDALPVIDEWLNKRKSDQ